MKKLLFWITFLPLALFTTIADLSVAIAVYWFASYEVLQVLFTRWEYWCFDVPVEEFLNDPWKKTLKRVWNEAIDDM